MDRPGTRYRRPRSIEEALKIKGYWYPPDAIQAVREGRTTYHPIDPTVTYTLSEPVRKLIQQAIDLVERRPELIWPLR